MALRKELQLGFTLIEMMVVLGIMALVSSIIVFNYSDYNSLINTRNLAQEIGLTIRKTQSYATTSHILYDTSGNAINDYGIVFSKDLDSMIYTPNSQNFLIFAAFADPSRGETQGRRFNMSNWLCGQKSISLYQECLESYSIDKSSYISDIEQLNSNGVATPITSGNVNIVFHRPAPDADMCVLNNGLCVAGQNASATQITVSSYNKKSAYVITVWTTGQISVQDCKDLSGNRCPS